MYCCTWCHSSRRYSAVIRGRLAFLYAELWVKISGVKLPISRFIVTLPARQPLQNRQLRFSY